MSAPGSFREWVMVRAKIDLVGGRPATPSERVKVALYRAMRADPSLDIPNHRSGATVLARWINQHDVIWMPKAGEVRDVAGWVWTAYRAASRRKPLAQDRVAVEAYIGGGGL